MKKILMAAAVFCCMTMSLTMTSCTSDIEDNPAPVVDYGQWNVPDSDMDISVRPGDDFYMYCNGGYWNSTEINETWFDIKSIMVKDIPAMIEKRMSALHFPNMDKLMDDAAKVDSADIWTRLNTALARIDAITTREEAWQLWGQLIKEGYASQIGVDFFSMGGRIGVTIDKKANDYDAVLDTPDKNSFQWQLLNDPDVLACIHPLGGFAARGTFDHDKWPMLTTIFTELGFNLDDVYSIDVAYLRTPEIIEELVTEYQELQSYDVEKWKKHLTDQVSVDTVLLNSEVRSTLVKNFANRYLRYEKSYLFTNAYVTSEMKQRTLDYCTQLRETFRQRIAANEWMSEGSKQSATEKLDAMVFNIGCPDEWFPEGIADISNEKTLIDDIMALRRNHLALFRRMAGMDTPRACWHAIMTMVDLTVMNAFYVPIFNSMNIYPAWMMEPLYDPQQNDAHNYATLMVFGHEITHGFDTNGAKYNKIGDLEDIWASDADRQEFDKRAQQLVDCYNGFEVMPWALPGVYADGAYTVAENIADLGGVLLAYDTYVRHLCETGFKGEQFDLQRQRFFLALAKLWQTKYSAKYVLLRTNGDDAYPGNKDNHSLSRERINGMVMNTDAWYDLFSVKAGDKLYRAPKDRVRIW